MVSEGTPLCVCCDRSQACNTTDIRVMVFEKNSSKIQMTVHVVFTYNDCCFTVVNSDFESGDKMIPGEQNCTIIRSIDDDQYERSKLYTVILVSSSMPSEVNISYTILLKDNDGECWRIYIRIR